MSDLYYEQNHNKLHEPTFEEILDDIADKEIKKDIAKHAIEKCWSCNKVNCTCDEETMAYMEYLDDLENER